MLPSPPISTLFPYTTLFRSSRSLMRNSARAGAAIASASAAATRWLGNHRARIRRTAHYSVVVRTHRRRRDGQIGRASCRERVEYYVVAVSLEQTDASDSCGV